MLKAMIGTAFAAALAMATPASAEMTEAEKALY